MTHVQPKNVCSARDQFPNRFRFLGRRAERADDFCLPHFLECSSLPGGTQSPKKKRHAVPAVPRVKTKSQSLFQLALSLLGKIAMLLDHFGILGRKRLQVRISSALCFFLELSQVRLMVLYRSEERRVGKECRFRVSR